MIKRNLIIPLLAVVAMLGGCNLFKKDEPDKPIPYYKTPQGMKDYVIFKPGTYWVYQDLLGGGRRFSLGY